MITAARTSSKRLPFALAVLFFALVIGLFCYAIMSAPAAFAETSAEKQAEADEISARIDELQTSLNEAAAEYDRASKAHEEAQAKADAAEQRAKEAQARVKSIQERLSSRVISMYRNGGSMRFFDVLLGAASFEEFLTSWDAIETISGQDANLVAQSKAARAEAEAAEAEFREQQQRAAEEMQAAQEAEEQLAADKAALEEELEKVNEEIAVLLAHEEEERIAAEEAARREAFVQQYFSDPGSFSFDPSMFDGWIRPCSYYGVTCEFGYSPITYSHNGIDLGASYGTPIYAAGPGTVTYTGWYGTGGNAVIISHGNGVRTIYMHQSEIAASVGQSVAAGDLIGYVGSTGLSTGPHLHFQLEIGGVPTNPRNIMSF